MREHFDLRPAAIVRDLELRRPIYRKTAAYGHFGRSEPEFTWERTDRAAALARAAKLDAATPRTSQLELEEYLAGLARAGQAVERLADALGRVARCPPAASCGPDARCGSTSRSNARIVSALRSSVRARSVVPFTVARFAII